MRKIIWLLLLSSIIAIPIVMAGAECSQVFIVKFNYDNSVITYRDKVVKCGYAPDRNIQPVEGYKAEIISIDNKPLHSFKFNIPLKLNVDLVDPVMKSLSGGMIILSETDFAMIFPYYDDAKSIIIYNPRDYQIAIIPLIEEQFMQKKTFWWVLILAVFLLVVSSIIYMYYRNRQQS